MNDAVLAGEIVVGGGAAGAASAIGRRIRVYLYPSNI